MNDLNNQETIFVAEYVVSLDPEDAAIKAGYSATMAHSKAYAWVSNSKTNTKPHVFAAIQEKLNWRTDRLDELRRLAIEETAAIALSDIRKTVSYDENSLTVVPSDKLDDMAAKCISEVVYNVGAEGGQVRVKYHPKGQALDMLHKLIGTYAPEKSKTESTNTNLNLNVDYELTAQDDDMLRRLRDGE